MVSVDDPRPKARREEYVVHGLTPERAHQLVSDRSRGHYCITAILGPEEAVEPRRDEYKALGYRLNHTEPFMSHGLTRIPRAVSPATIRRVNTEAMADQLAAASGQRQILPEHLAKNSRQRCYVAFSGEIIVGWVTSVANQRATYCAAMYVKPAHRRHGIGRALVTRMLREDRSGGARQALLLASSSGAKLYAGVGYEEIGKAMIFTPRRRP